LGDAVEVGEELVGVHGRMGFVCGVGEVCAVAREGWCSGFPIKNVENDEKIHTTVSGPSFPQVVSGDPSESD